MKKTLFALVFSLFLIFLTLKANIQSDGPIMLTLKIPPPGKLNLENFWGVTLTNNSGSEQSVYLVGAASESKAGQIVKGTTVPFLLKSGTTILKIKDLPKTPDIEYTSSDPRYKESLARTGNFPEGQYEICVKVFSAGTNEELGSDCINQEVIETGLLTLINPTDGEDIESKVPVTFTWSSGRKVPEGGYTLRICEVMENQTPETAMEGNKAWFEQNGIKSTTFTYPNSAKGFIEGNEYVWMISIEDLKSEALAFKISNEEPVLNTDGLRAPMTCSCAFTTPIPSHPTPLDCTTPTVGYKITLPSFSATAPCTATLQYQLDGVGGWSIAPLTGPLNIATLSSGSHTIIYRLKCIDAPNPPTYVNAPSSYNYTFTVNPPIPLGVNVCDSPTGNINKGCSKSFNVTVPGTACDNNSIAFPSACKTSYYYFICRANTQPLIASYPIPTVGTFPALTTFTGASTYPSTTCLTSSLALGWYQIPNDGDNYKRTAPMPENLPAISGSDKYYVICFIANPCCFLSKYATVCPGFKVLQTTYPVVSRIVCSPPAYSPTNYNQCCEKVFTLKKVCTNPGPTGITGATYHWIVLKSSSAVYPGDPPCWASVTDNLTIAGCPGASMTNGTWYKWGTSTPTITAPLLPASTEFYYVTCYIQICNPAAPNTNSQFISGFAEYQKFQVLNPTGPTPIITWNDPLFLATSITNTTGITTVTRFIPPLSANITLSVDPNSLPSSGTTTYQWYESGVSGVASTAPTYDINTTGTHNVYVYTTTTNPGIYISPGCRVRSQKIIVRILDCPGTNTACVNATLDGTIVKTRLNNTGSITTKTVNLGLTPELQNYVSAIQSTTGSCNIDFGSNFIKFVFSTPNSSARFDGGSIFTFTNIKPPKISGVQPIICRVDVINHLSPYTMNADPIITFTDNSVTCQFAANSLPYYHITNGDWIRLDLSYACP